MTSDEFNDASAALRRRSPTELAGFIESLLTDSTSGVGTYARAFAAESCAASARIIEDAISCWRLQRKHDTYHQAAACAQQLDWTLDAIERCIRPQDPQTALALLVRFFEADEDLGQDDLDHIADAYQRAAAQFHEVAKSCPPDVVNAARERLLENDNTGFRAWLT